MAMRKKAFRFDWILLAFLVVISTSMLGYAAKHVGVEKNTSPWGSAVNVDVQNAVEDLETIAALMEELKYQGVPDRDTLNTMLKAVLRKNPNYLATWTCWEPNALDNRDYQFVNNNGHDETGRFIPYWNRLDGQIDLAPLSDYDEQGKGDFYSVPLESGKATIFNPVEYKTKDGSLDKIVVTAPIYYDDLVVGVVGIDIPVK